MPGSTPLPIDLRSYRPAAVLVLDLVGHSKRDQAITMAVQGAMNEALLHVVASLHLQDAHFNHTGDGYVCTLAGDASARVIDFANALYPELQKRLAPYGQEVRGGLAFGLVHFRKDQLTQTNTHFDLPGIEAARLEQVASPGQLLVSETAHSIFQRHYPNAFAAHPIALQAKDRGISAYEFKPEVALTAAIKEQLTRHIFRRTRADSRERAGSVLIVDDHPLILDGLVEIVSRISPNRPILRASSGEQALAIFATESCALVITDLVMPGIDGIQMARAMKERVPSQIVVAFTAYGVDHVRRSFYEAGGFILLHKGIQKDWVSAITYALQESSGDALRQQLLMVCDDVVGLWCALDDVADKIAGILNCVGDGRDVAQELLRHKAKHLINNSISRLGVGIEPIEQFNQLATQLACVERLARIVGRLGVQKIGPFLSKLIDDLRRTYFGVEFAILDEIDEDTQGEVRCGGVVVLAIAELVDNAAAAVGDRGSVEVELATLRAKGLLQIVVQDSGPGVPADIQIHMYDENVSTKGSGRGIGLHLVREAVRLLRGSIDYDRRQKSTFRIQIPLNA